MTQDAEHLKLLSIFHYVVAGLAALFSMFPIFHLVFGIFLIASPDKFGGKGAPPPAFLGWFFVIFAAVFILGGLTFAVALLVSGRFLAKRKHYTYCLVMAGVACLFMPFGTVLGIFSLVVLLRESVKLQFLAGPPPPPGSPTAAAPGAAAG